MARYVADYGSMFFVLVQEKIIYCAHFLIPCDFFRKVTWVFINIVQPYVLMWILHILCYWMMILSIQVLPYSV